MTEIPGIDDTIPPSGLGCVECLAAGGWWLHLRRCAQCGHVGCCDSSPATKQFYEGPPLAPPEHRPVGQPTPGPEGRVPPDWKHHLH